MTYKLKINPEQVFNLTAEQVSLVKEGLSYAINYMKRPRMMIGDTFDSPITDREKDSSSFFSKIIQDMIIFKWIDRPENESDILNAMEDLQLYFWYSNQEKMHEYIEWQITYHTFGDKGGNIGIDRAQAWIEAMDKWDNRYDPNWTHS